MTDLHTPRPTSGPGRPPPGMPSWYVAAVAAILAAITVLLVVLVVVAIRDDDQNIQTAVPTTDSSDSSEPTLPSSTEPTATTEPTTSTTGGDTSAGSTTSASTTSSTSVGTTTSVATTATSTTTTPPTSFVPAVWPWLDSSTRYDDPIDAARGFAEDFLGFRDPVLGPYQAGDGRSGEVELQPSDDGPITTVLVRQVSGDDSWWVIGAATANIQVTSPDALEEVDSPLEVKGEALAFEGSVDVDLLADGSSTPIASGSVTGGGTELAPFEGSFEFDWPDEAGGAVVFRTTSAEDGQVLEASVVRIRFALPG